MKMWFLVVTLIDPSYGAKVAPFATELECKKAMQQAVKELKGSKVVQKIECLEGEMDSGDTEAETPNGVPSMPEESDKSPFQQETSKKKQYL